MTVRTNAGCTAAVTAERDAPQQDALPAACTLGPQHGASRLRRWQELEQRAAPMATLDGGRLEVRYAAGPGVADELAELAAAEQDCCSFVDWQVTTPDGQPVLHVVAPAASPEAVEPIAAMFGATGS